LSAKSLELLRKKLLKHSDVSLFEKQGLEVLNQDSGSWGKFIPGGAKERVAILTQFFNGVLIRTGVKQHDAIKGEYLRVFAALPGPTRGLIEKMLKRMARGSTDTVKSQVQTAIKSAVASVVAPVKEVAKPKSKVVLKPQSSKPKTQTTPSSEPIKPSAGGPPVRQSAEPRKRLQIPAAVGPKIVLLRCPEEIKMDREPGALVLRIFGSDALLEKIRLVIKSE
jgi:hypothetical protein